MFDSSVYTYKETHLNTHKQTHLSTQTHTHTHNQTHLLTHSHPNTPTLPHKQRTPLRCISSASFGATQTFAEALIAPCSHGPAQ